MVDSPLNDNDLNRINQSLDELNRAEQLIQTAKRGGIDVTAHEEKARETKARLLKMKQAFFPGR